MTDRHRRLVLVVDDDSDTRELYRMLLESVGYRVEDAGHVRTATAAALALVPDVVVTDWLLPDGEGLDVGRALRANRHTRRIPIVAVTGVTLDPPAEETASLEGITAILQKPANPDDILSAISTALTKAVERRLCDAATRTRRYAALVRRLGTSTGRPSDVGLDPGAMLERVASRSDQSVALVLADDSGRHVAASGAIRELTGYDAAELAGLTVWDLAPLTGSADGKGLWNQFIATGAQQGRSVLRRRDGRAVDAQYCAIANIAPGWHVTAFAEMPALPLTLGAF
jgi:PAS domain S-box-containing protein